MRAVKRVGTAGRNDWRSVALTTDPVEQALAQIRHVTRSTTLRLALDVGEIVFNLIFGGDVRALRDRGPKDASFRALALHPDLPMSASNLWRSVSTYELSVRLPQVATSLHLNVSHVRAVLGLPTWEQEKLLKRADAERWEASRLATHAASRRKGPGGRPRKPAVLRTLDTLRGVAALPLSRFADLAAVQRMSREDLEVALETLRELNERVLALQKLLLAAKAEA